jgi:hypothetical protein
MQYLPSLSKGRSILKLRRIIRGDQIPHTVHEVSLLGKNVYKLVTEQHYEEHCCAPKSTAILVLLFDLIDRCLFYLRESNWTALFVASHLNIWSYAVFLAVCEMQYICNINTNTKRNLADEGYL